MSDDVVMALSAFVCGKDSELFPFKQRKREFLE
jgi:hypothetical protein